MSSLPELVREWEGEATVLRERYARPDLAALCEAHARELAAAIQTARDEELTLTAASKESGYAARTLREKLAKGEIPNAGRKGAPRIRRGDLPIRARSNSGEWDAEEHVRDIMQGGR